MNAVRAALAWSPFPDATTARDVARQLLAEKLIACANIIPAVESVFEWEGEVSSGQETAVVFKTTQPMLEQLIARLGELHPYDTPAITGWVCSAAHPATLEWLAETFE